MLDREIRDAGPCVQVARAGEGIRGTGVEAAAASAAPVRIERQVGREGGIGEHDADEREGADLGVNQHHVLADPTEPRALRELPLRHRPGVHVDPGRGAGDDLPDRRRQLLEPPAEDVVVVGGPRILGYSRLTPGRRPGVSRPMEVVRKRDYCDPRPRHDACRVFAFLGLAVQVGHGAGVARREPAVEIIRVRVPLERRDPDGVEPQRRSPTLHFDVLLDGVHSPIVSRRQRAKFATSSTGGIAFSSP